MQDRDPPHRQRDGRRIAQVHVRRDLEVVDVDIRLVETVEQHEAIGAGIDEPLLEGARMLSAGERQLLSFARAVAADPPILILDEATANIDPLTEDLIQKALQNITTRRTSIIIAHRLSTIRHADSIIVLHKGAIREQGTHAQLMEKRGMYYRMSQLQYLSGS